MDSNIKYIFGNQKTKIDTLNEESIFRVLAGKLKIILQS